MTDISQMIRWNTNFVRGLAQSVLERARVIRSGLTSYSAVPESSAPARKARRAKAKPGKKSSRKHNGAKASRAPRRRRG